MSAEILPKSQDIIIIIIIITIWSVVRYLMITSLQFTAKGASEGILTVGQYLMKLRILVAYCLGLPAVLWD